jgi:hypothetical protein
MCFFLLIFWGLFTRKDHLTHHNIFIFMTVTNNIYQKQIKYHEFRVDRTYSGIKMWSFLKHYDGAQPGKRKTASATLTGD